jgi:hypothetical protein
LGSMAAREGVFWKICGESSEAAGISGFGRQG